MTAKNGKNRRTPARNGFGTANTGKSRHSRRNLTIQRRNKRQTATDKMNEDQRTLETMKAQRRLMQMEYGRTTSDRRRDALSVCAGVFLLASLFVLAVYLLCTFGWRQL